MHLTRRTFCLYAATAPKPINRPKFFLWSILRSFIHELINTFENCRKNYFTDSAEFMWDLFVNCGKFKLFISIFILIRLSINFLVHYFSHTWFCLDYMGLVHKLWRIINKSWFLQFSHAIENLTLWSPITHTYLTLATLKSSPTRWNWTYLCNREWCIGKSDGVTWCIFNDSMSALKIPLM